VAESEAQRMSAMPHRRLAELFRRLRKTATDVALSTYGPNKDNLKDADVEDEDVRSYTLTIKAPEK